ncbi:MAG: hypothetical protein M1823_001911 [Watsoniomyces obsoletus]|nr:MAG: hypothetical protein M1823_001911 [Watsoniomyces obsoletus]
MATMERLQKLSSAAEGGDISSSEALLDDILAGTSSSNNTVELYAYVEVILSDSLGIFISRTLLDNFISKLSSHQNPEVIISAGKHALELQQPRVSSFEEQNRHLREIMAEVYEQQDEHLEAAKILQGIPLDNLQRNITDEGRIRVWIRIVRNYLELNDTMSADMYLNKAKAVMHNCGDPELRLMFQLSHARILDSQRKFLDACREYYELSFAAVVVEEERMKALAAAMVCAVLAPAGPLRSRNLARLYKDERAQRLPEYGILEKMFLDRLLSPDEVASFANTLKEHHLAKTADGSTVLERAVTEHNLVGASKVYEDIRFEELGVLLGKSPEQAEDYAARMIEQGRLAGQIDQIKSVIHFNGADGGGGVVAVDGGASGGMSDGTGTGGALRRWDRNVQGLAEEVERVTGMLQTQYPDFVAATALVQ